MASIDDETGDLQEAGTTPAGSQATSAVAAGSQDAGFAPDDTPSEVDAASAGAQAQADRTVAEVIRELGYTLPENASDYDALQFVHRQAQQAREYQRKAEEQDFYARLGQQIAPHAQQFQGYLEQTKAKATPERKPWEAPPFDQRWMQMVQQDQATGVYVAKPGVDPTVAKNVNDYYGYVQRFLENPAATITAAAEHVAAQKFDEMFAQRMAEYQRQAAVAEIVQANSAWFYARNADGTPVTDPSTGRAVVSEVGALYLDAARRLADAGVDDPRSRDALAKQIARGVYAETKTPAPSKAQAAAAQASALRQSRGSVNPLQALASHERRETPGATDPSAEGLSFREMTMRAFQHEGITDSDFSPDTFSS